MINNQLMFSKRNIYSLKRQYGRPIDIYHITGYTQDLETGKQVTLKDKYPIRKGVILPTALTRQLNLKGAAARPSFESPAQGFDVVETLLIIDNDDLPNGFDLSIDDYIVIDKKRYDIKEINELEDNIATLLTLRHVKGAEGAEIHGKNIAHSLIFNQNATAEVV